jgi:1-acyl-sn-glycerol-3-phosphate acyltransferase
MIKALYHFMRIPTWLVINFAFLPKVYNSKNLHFRQSCIVIANHTSNWDPILLAHLVFPVCVQYLAKEELFKNAFTKKFLQWIGVIPVGRGKGDLKAMKMSLSVLKKGESLGIFPEGHRIFAEELGQFEIGPTAIALKTNTPVLPVYLDGKGYRLFHRVRVMVGEKLDLSAMANGKSDSETVAQMTEVLRQKLMELKGKIRSNG